MGAEQPARCPHCGNPIGDDPVDAGARGETGSAEMVCTACGRTIRLDEGGPGSSAATQAGGKAQGTSSPG